MDKNIADIRNGLSDQESSSSKIHDQEVNVTIKNNNYG